MLIRLLRTFLSRYRNQLLIVLALTFVQTMCTLFLPALNADIIDKGVITGDTDYIWRTGGLMLFVTLVQVAFAIAAVYFGSRVAMAFGRDVRGALFHRVTNFSAQDVAAFGAPSLITRITNDVTQVQMLVLMSCTLLVAAPFTIVGGVILAVREDAALSLLLRGRHPGARGRDRPGDRTDGAPVPGDARAHRPHQPGAAGADHRDPRRRARSSASPTRPSGSARRTTRSRSRRSGRVG